MRAGIETETFSADVILAPDATRMRAGIETVFPRNHHC